MVLKPTYYLANLMTGDLYGEPLPLESVSLSSSLQPGQFVASLDMRKVGPRGEGYRILDLLANGKCTLVPVLEGLSTGAGNPPTSRALGEWWVSVVDDDPPSPIVSLSGPELMGYAKEVLVTSDRVGPQRDPVANARALIADLFRTSQVIEIDIPQYETSAREPIDIRKTTTDYWTAVSELQDSEAMPFEWMIRTGLELNGWSPVRVTRSLRMGMPRVEYPRPDVTLELTAPGTGPASVLSTSRSRSEHRSATTVYGWGAGSGKTQYGGPGVFTSRNRQVGEPVKTRMITDQAAMSNGQVLRKTRAALRRALPEEQVMPTAMPTDRYTPLVGEVYTWRMDAQWTRRAESGTRRCVGWSWSSNGADVYQLDLTEV